MKKNILQELIQKGVNIYLPESVYISEDINPDRISNEKVTIYPGTRITGKETLIMKGCQIGKEAPVTLDNCKVGEHCNLKGGYFQDSVFAGHNSVGSGAHVRSGTILEEQSNAAHSVGLKQTILFPFVTIGSLVNFCDCLMSGGTSRKDHSEVGSSFIHFNYTPNQDKATASLIGNVHQGVMLDQPPIFLGGQGGMVGPCRIGFGCVTAAGSIVRKDEIQTNKLIFGAGFKEMTLPKNTGIYGGVKRIYNNNIYYIAALFSLKAWYDNIRPLFVYDSFSRAIIKGMQDNLQICLEERIKRLFDFIEKIPQSRELLLTKLSQKPSLAVEEHDLILSKLKTITAIFQHRDQTDLNHPQIVDGLIAGLTNAVKRYGNDYINVIQNLSPEIKTKGIHWLTLIENQILNQALL